jgi:molybdate transport repressor ModE-like protein
MNEQALDWNDLRLVLAISREGSLTGAAKVLGVSHPTVFRRLHQMEQMLETRLFERALGRYVPTPSGERIMLAAERVETEVIAVEREVRGRDTRLAGQLKITCSETLAFRVLNQLLAEFRRKYAGIEIELIVDNRPLDLSRHEADIAIRATRPKEEDLFGRKLANAAWAIYGSRAYFDTYGKPAGVAGLAGHLFIGWDKGIGGPAAQWMAESIPAPVVVYRSSSPINHLMAAAAGIGLALLPCYVGDLEPKLTRVTAPIPELTRELWLITHKDLRNTARVRAFFDVIGNGLARKRPLIEGRTKE